MNGDRVTSAIRALASVQLEDVRPRGEVDLPADAAVASVSTFDGVTVNVRLAEVDRKKWADFEAVYTGATSDQSDAAKAARARVEDINSRLGDWTYWVPSSTFENLTRPLESVLVAKKGDSS